MAFDPLPHTIMSTYLFFAVVIDCGGLTSPAHGGVVLTTTIEGSTAVYICNQYYCRNGSGVRTCRSDGQWDGTAPVCQRERIHCL